MKSKIKRAHMKAAIAYAECSTAVRKKIGCVIVKGDRIISIGYNGTPEGWDNCCEYTERVWDKNNPASGSYDELKTKPEVLHAETNAIAKLAKGSESGEGAISFQTVSPCFECAKLMYQSGIKEVYYLEKYRLDDGIEFLEKCGIKVEEMDDE